jgi:hypothetical protein
LLFPRTYHRVLSKRQKERPDPGVAGVARTEGTPQGGPLSPLLSNILLTDLDRELERRGHRFCRYADDCNIYVKSEMAGLHAMEATTEYLEKKLKLRVNRDKSAVARPWQRKFLGYSVTWHKQARLKIAGSSVKRLKDKVREIVVGNAFRNLGQNDRRPYPRAAWLDILFPADRGKRCVAGLGRMDTAQTALPALAAMEASGHSWQATTRARVGRDASMESGKQREMAPGGTPVRAI